MLKGVLHLGKGRLLIDKFRRPQVREQPLQLVFRLVDYPLEQAQRELFADHGKGLEQFFLSEWEPVDARGQYCLHGSRDLNICREERVASGRGQAEAVRPYVTVGSAHPTRIA